ncbi:MAG: hypothetical protein MRJ93_04735 [Nitrososphaeraceae archaeon]|nr:hypothetical protein [Nitrososphaeraceae archaeon]
MQHTSLQNKTKVVRISDKNYNKVISIGRYGETFDSILSKFLNQEEAKDND